MAFIRVVNKPLGGPVEIIKGGTIQSGYDAWVTPNLSASGWSVNDRTGNNVSAYTGGGYGAVTGAPGDTNVNLTTRCLIYFTSAAVGKKCTVTWSSNASARYGTFRVYAYATGYGYALNKSDIWSCDGNSGSMEFTVPASGYIDLYAHFEGNSASWGPALNSTIGSLILS